MQCLITTIILFIPIGSILLILYGISRWHERCILVKYCNKMIEIELLLAANPNIQAYENWWIDIRIPLEKIITYNAQQYVDTYLKYYSTPKEFDTLRTREK